MGSRYASWVAAGVGVTLLCLAAPPAPATYIPYPTPVDVDKSHEAGNWLTNWYDDIDNDNNWDMGAEPYADSAQPLWGNPKSARDLSCWLAAAANLLAAGGHGDSAAIYQTFLGNYGWRVQGSPDTALAWYIANYPSGSVYTQIYVYSPSNHQIENMPVRDFLAMKLRTPELIALDMSPGDPGWFDHAVTLWGDDLQPNWQPGGPSPTQLYITDSDTDVVGDWVFWDDVDVYNWLGPDTNNYSQPNGYTVTKVVTLGPVPEPNTAVLLLVGLGLLARRVRRKR